MTTSVNVAFPAGAGMNRVGTADLRIIGGVPRRRGDEPYQGQNLTDAAVRSPQARG